MTAPTTDTLLQMTGIVKEFPGVRALDGVDLDVRAGEVHCRLTDVGARPPLRPGGGHPALLHREIPHA